MAEGAVLLLHGQPGRGSDFRAAMSWVHAKEISVVSPDRPGWGSGDGMALDVAGNAAWAAQFLGDKTVVVGYSFGAAVAALVAIEHPDLVAGLVLVAPVATESALLAVDYVLARRLVGRMLVGSLNAVCSFSPGWAHYRRDGESFHAEQRHLVAELAKVESRLGELRMQTSVIYGLGDRIIPARSVADLATRVSQTQLVIVPGHGHRLLATAPVVVGETIGEVVRATGVGGQNCNSR